MKDISLLIPVILHYLDKETGKIIIFSNDAITADQLIGDYYSENRRYEGHY